MTPGQRPRPLAEQVTDDRTLAVVVALAGRYRAPSTSLIASRLAHGRSVSPAVRRAAAAALERLCAAGYLAYLRHRGIDRWTPVDRSAAKVAARAGEAPVSTGRALKRP